MQLIRGTTPNIVATVKNDTDLSVVTQVWFYISQQNKPKVDKLIEDVVIDTENKTISAILSQDDTLALRAGDALFQIRLLTNDGTALASVAQKITILEVYKGGVIE